AGATMQGLFRNPMADPGIIGVSAGGALGAVIAIAAGLTGLFFLALPLFAFAGAIAAAFLVYGIAVVGGHFSMATLLLAGVAVNAFLGAIVSAIIIFLPDNELLREVLFWLAGGLDARAWEHVRIATPLIVGSTAVLLLMSRDLNLMMLGDDEARSMGVRVGVTRVALLATAALATGAAVAVSGTIAFVGLVIPHVLRLVLGPDNRVLIPMSALGGAVFVMAADTVARMVIEPAEIRVGILTAFVGAPFFIFLLIKNKRQVYSL
ncbi:MAG: iron chelate uptake ABC transporter family permease subunit, partial [Dehalococcoidia bacterium]|nr:iron chelate uptake ABC transporter family permease subunit [Dehalococcoidia bacterium]